MIYQTNQKAPRYCCRPQVARPARSVPALAHALLGATALGLVMALGAHAAFAQSTGQQSGQSTEQPSVTQPADAGGTTATTTAPDMTSEAGTEQATETAVPVPGQIVEQSEQTYGVRELIGTEISSPDGEFVAEVVDVLLSEDNQVAGVVVGVGGFLGIGAKEIALEIDSVTMSMSSEGEQRLTLDLTREDLERAPEFVSLAAQRSAAEEEQMRRQLDQAQQNTTQPGSVAPTGTQ